ncbi:hypothetical protein PHYBLDRAFT_160489 [Phycomyces blakesleeanus NRRL 1555(-)]|uniref:Uncharacterized protein n=1 Tax=Phycomyces blakesleeanus (strain ATCC 8743b / DSM 1359 / FGSC 10004 / NBRC 33097 / NRRL 1555) TaxID=763407 RepID=A0A162TAE5_PHYB8|nr:hypothetical protein PHYBLDRAFT_160489 [Phycomyces blakesleeanus NRRL 1555(-)]OAD67192.1 hypothetical protein PHYBLDRAFT_160489 [Phycomyces blakesleeanus NRRL 1555(-)]|eukprot:XP_018285232.1 hypothetical protein PHYBLDRAFT_160489 [Phycomyces blakesleeanus NRRL 1555(-)]
MSTPCPRSNLYDSLPKLETWYSSEAVEYVIPQKKPSQMNRNVSFSTEPPSVHYLDDQEEEEEVVLKEHQRAMNSSVRSFLKHCARKFGHHSSSSRNAIRHHA